MSPDPESQATTVEEIKAFVVDTNVLINDPGAIFRLRDGGNHLYIPLVVLEELDKNKKKPDIGIDVREAIRNLRRALAAKDGTIFVVRKVDFSGMDGIDQRHNDNRIIAVAKNVFDENEARKKGAGKKKCKLIPAGIVYDQVSLVSGDNMVLIMADQFGVQAEEYRSDQVEIKDDRSLAVLRVNFHDVYPDPHGGFCFRVNRRKKAHAKIAENEGVICLSDYRFYAEESAGEFTEAFAAVRRGDKFHIIPPDINALGVIKPYSLTNGNGNGNGKKNWAQAIALWLLLNQDIKLIVLEGGAGSGKTLCALAAAFDQKSMVRKIIISRPMIPVDDDDRMGFLPGDMKEKTRPWMIPIEQNLRFLRDELGKVQPSKGNKNAKKKNAPDEDDPIDDSKWEIQPLEYIRGATFHKSMIIIDDAQNLTKHQVKTIITRVGLGTRIVFTGDLGQIDRLSRINKKTSGMAHLINKLGGNKMVAVCRFQETVRSPLAELAEEML